MSLEEVPIAAKSEHKSEKLLEKNVTNVEEAPCTYAATVNTTHPIPYERKDCGEKWTETKEESKLN